MSFKHIFNDTNFNWTASKCYSDYIPISGHINNCPVQIGENMEVDRKETNRDGNSVL